MDQLHLFLSMLKERHVEMVVCTNSFVGVARRCLADLGLQDFFSAIYGRVGNPHGQTDYEKESSAPASAEETKLLGSEKDIAQGFGTVGKVAKLRDLKAQSDLNRTEIVVVDSDPRVIEECKSNAIAHSLHVPDSGLRVEDMVSLQQVTSAHLQALRELVGLDPLLRVANPAHDSRDMSDVEVFHHWQAIQRENEAFEEALLGVAAPVLRKPPNTVLSLFKQWDADNSGGIELPELESVLLKIGFPAEVIPRIFAEMDADMNGIVDYNEFCDWIFGTRLGSRIKDKLKIQDLPACESGETLTLGEL